MSQKNSIITSKKPFCKVCQDAGKHESDYTSHWVKDQTGKTTCPTLLNTECRFCHKLGHTSKFCKEIEKMNKEQSRRSSQVKSVEVKVAQKKPINAYAVLDEDSEEEDVKIAVLQSTQKIDWASIAAKPKNVESVIQSNGFITLSRNKKQKPEPVPEPVRKEPVPELCSKPMKKWADLSDIEDDEEVEDDTW